MGIKKKRNDSELLTNSRGSHLRAIRIKTYVGKYPYICLLPERPVTKRHCKKIYRQIVIYKQDTK